MRFISLTFNIENNSLDVNIENFMQANFDNLRAGNYFYDTGIIKKYLDFSMYYKAGEYYSKKYLIKEQG